VAANGIVDSIDPVDLIDISDGVEHAAAFVNMALTEQTENADL
jgi:hypothetical protein